MILIIVLDFSLQKHGTSKLRNMNEHTTGKKLNADASEFSRVLGTWVSVRVIYSIWDSTQGVGYIPISLGSSYVRTLEKVTKSANEPSCMFNSNVKC